MAGDPGGRRPGTGVRELRRERPPKSPGCRTVNRSLPGGEVSPGWCPQDPAQRPPIEGMSGGAEGGVDD